MAEYGQLAEARGVSRRAAVRLAQLHRLRRQPGNDGKTLVWVPPDFATRATRPGVKNAGAGDDAPIVAGGATDGLSAEINALRDALVAVREARDGEIATLCTSLGQALARLVDAQGRARQAETQVMDERVRADQVRAQVDELRDRLAQVQADEIARKAQPRWRRAWAVWRG
jgi:hypothetical protein